MPLVLPLSLFPPAVIIALHLDSHKKKRTPARSHERLDGQIYWTEERNHCLQLPSRTFLLILWNHSVGQHFTIIPEMDLYQSGGKKHVQLASTRGFGDDLRSRTTHLTFKRPGSLNSGPYRTPERMKGFDVYCRWKPNISWFFSGYKITGGFYRQEFRRIQGMERARERIRGAFLAAVLCVFTAVTWPPLYTRHTFKESPVSTEMLVWQ